MLLIEISTPGGDLASAPTLRSKSDTLQNQTGFSTWNPNAVAISSQRKRELCSHDLSRSRDRPGASKTRKRADAPSILRSRRIDRASSRTLRFDRDTNEPLSQRGAMNARENQRVERAPGCALHSSPWLIRFRSVEPVVGSDLEDDLVGADRGGEGVRPHTAGAGDIYVPRPV